VTPPAVTLFLSSSVAGREYLRFVFAIDNGVILTPSWPKKRGLKAIQEKVVKVSRFSIEFSKFLNAMDTIHHYAGAGFQSAGTAAHHLSGWVQRLK